MFRFDRPRRALATLALAAMLIAPLPTRALGGDAATPDETRIGVIFAVICGASASISRLAPGIPIVVSVTIFSCAAMLMDAMASPDTP